MSIEEYEATISPEAQQLFQFGSSNVRREEKHLLDELSDAGLVLYKDGRDQVVRGIKEVISYRITQRTDEGQALHDALEQRRREGKA